MSEQATNRRRTAAICAWLAVAIACAAVIGSRLEITVDLAFFLPAPESRQEQVLIDRLGQGPGSRLLFVTLKGADKFGLQSASARLRTTLEQSKLFSRVINGQEELSVAAIPAEIWQYRYLLNDIDWTVDGLRTALQARVADLSVLSGADIAALIGSDPHLASVASLDSLAVASQTRDAAWINETKGTAYLIAESTAPAFDVAGQIAAVNFIRASAAGLDTPEPELHGVGAYSAALQDTISSEAQFRSVLATAAIMAVLFAAYRSVALVLLAAVPLLLGGLAGLAAVALLFGEVHGITLAFGFTLFGVVVDYPLHLFSHAGSQTATRAIRTIWPTLRLGALSTVLAYLALTVSGSAGLAQLGVLSAVGVVVALYATRTLLPELMGPKRTGGHLKSDDDQAASAPALRHSVWLGGFALGAIAVAAQNGIWTNDLASLTPLPPETLLEDNELRDAFGAPDIRYLLVLTEPTEEQALQATEQFSTALTKARGDGVFAEALTVTSILPSRRTQEARRQALSAIDDLDSRLAIATQDLPFRNSAFDGFVAHVRSTAELAPLTSAQIDDPFLKSFVGNHLYFDGEYWNSTVTLYGLSDPGQLEAWVAMQSPGINLIDLKAASESLVLNYRARIVAILSLALLLIVGILAWRIRMGTRLLWVVGNLAGAIALTVAINAAMLGQLSIFNLIALVLVAGLGLDYALFMSRTESRVSEAQRTLHAVRVCAGSTLLAFGVLALSSVPILASIGTTVATGVVLNYALAWAGSPRQASA